MAYLIVICVAYLLGSSNMTYYIAAYRGVNVRDKGSGNLGASNAAILLGWPSAVAVFIHDAGKSIVAVILAKLIFPDVLHIGAAAGVASVLGHIFPFYLGFKGGKGFASYLGMTIALNWKLALIILAVVFVVTLITDYVVVGTITTIIAVPTTLGIIDRSLPLALILLIATAVILYKHRENFVRLKNGTEIGLRSTAKGEHRIK